MTTTTPRLPPHSSDHHVFTLASSLTLGSAATSSQHPFTPCTHRVRTQQPPNQHQPTPPTKHLTHPCILQQLFLECRHLLLPRLQHPPHPPAIPHNATQPQQGSQALGQVQAVIGGVFEGCDPGGGICRVFGGGCNDLLFIITVVLLGVE